MDIGTAHAASGIKCERPTDAAPVEKLLRLSNSEYRNLASDLLQVPVEEELFSHWTPLPEVYGFDTMTEARVDVRTLEEQLRTSGQLAVRALASAAFTENCPPEGAPESRTWENCGAAIAERVASGAYRRPLREGELGDLQQLFEEVYAQASTALMPDPFQEAFTALVQAVLISPQTAFKAELVPGGFDESERNYALASKLSFFFRASTADEELWSLAESGQLADPEVLRAQAERLLEQYQDRVVEDFAGQWLGFREDAGDAPAADELTASMRAESRAVFADILTNNLPPSALLMPGFTYADAALAERYGLAFDPSGEPLQRIATYERGGLLSQGYFLTTTAHGSDFRRAIHRGLWTLTRLLCRQMPRLNAATAEQVAASLSAIDRTAPLSEQMEIHRSRGPQCMSCHGEVDPVGLALEKYDEQGRVRTVDGNGNAIKSSLKLFGRVVSDPNELAATIAEAPEYRHCVAEKALTYALNRGMRPTEQCVAQQIADARGAKTPVSQILVDAFLESIELVE